jgi:hypothetical protein
LRLVGEGACVKKLLRRLETSGDPCTAAPSLLLLSVLAVCTAALLLPLVGEKRVDFLLIARELGLEARGEGLERDWELSSSLLVLASACSRVPLLAALLLLLLPDGEIGLKPGLDVRLVALMGVLDSLLEGIPAAGDQRRSLVSPEKESEPAVVSTVRPRLGSCPCF